MASDLPRLRTAAKQGYHFSSISLMSISSQISAVSLHYVFSFNVTNSQSLIFLVLKKTMGPESSSATTSTPSPSGKRSRDPEDEVYLDNLRSHKRYLSEVFF